MLCRFILASSSYMFCAQALVAGNILLRRAKAESDKMLEGSAERLHLVVENEKLKKELAVLQALNDSR